MKLLGTTRYEKPYYNISQEWYKGIMPYFYDEKKLASTKVLKDNYNIIKKEILAYYDQHSSEINPNFTPYGYEEKGWQTVNLISYFFEYKKHSKHFPETMKALRQIPGLSMAQIAILQPGTRIKAHLGDTNAIVRNHLGIVIPGELPDLGIRIGNIDKCWEEGEVFSFCIVHRHYAWNYTDKKRIAFIVDFVRDEYHSKQHWIAARTLSVIAQKHIATKIPILKKIPVFMSRFINFFGGIFFWLVLKIKMFFNI